MHYPAHSWRYIPLLTGPGDFQMAVDNFLAQEKISVPVLRFYTWSPYSVSLGYHQHDDIIDLKKCDEAGVHVTRRPTGGRAVFHAEELTYALILPRKSSYAQGGIHMTHNRISQALTIGLTKIGVNASLNHQPVDYKQHYRSSPDGAACFSATSKYEVQIHGKKVIGSAQKQFKDAVLQHGSILIGTEHRHLPNFLKISEERKNLIRKMIKRKTTEIESHIPRKVDVQDLINVMKQSFREYFNIRFKEQPLLARERRGVFELTGRFRVKEVYA